MAWWNVKKNCARKWTLDIDEAGGTSADAVDSIDQSMQKVDLPANREVVACLVSDTGGGGTGNSVMIEIVKRGCAISNFMEFIVVTCAIH